MKTDSGYDNMEQTPGLNRRDKRKAVSEPHSAKVGCDDLTNETSENSFKDRTQRFLL